MVLFHSTSLVETSSGYPFFRLVFVLPERETLMLSVNSSSLLLFQPAVAIAAAFGLGDGFLCQCQENLLVILL